MMDLITTFQVMNLVAGVSAAWLLGVMGVALLKFFHTSPLLQTIVNTTLVVLESTEVVWRPIVNASMVILRPAAAFAVALLKPFGPLALVVADSIVKAMVVFGYVTTMVVIEAVKILHQCFRKLQTVGMSASTAVQNALTVSKDFAYSVATLVKAFTYFTIRLVNAASYIVTSFEKVGDFIYNLVFEAHKVTWEDIYAISLPFLVVASIVGYVIWRSTASCRKPVISEKKSDDYPEKPRRSSRLARKRAILLSSDASPILSCKETTSRATNL